MKLESVGFFLERRVGRGEALLLEEGNVHRGHACTSWFGSASQ